MTDRSGIRLEADVTMEQERESFSNRRGSRKILPENNMLSASSACSFLRWQAQLRLA
jgi:hypothetical protein